MVKTLSVSLRFKKAYMTLLPSKNKNFLMFIATTKLSIKDKIGQPERTTFPMVNLFERQSSTGIRLWVSSKCLMNFSGIPNSKR